MIRDVNGTNLIFAIYSGLHGWGNVAVLLGNARMALKHQFRNIILAAYGRLRACPTFPGSGDNVVNSRGRDYPTACLEPLRGSLFHPFSPLDQYASVGAARPRRNG